jgi:hypothetical protein
MSMQILWRRAYPEPPQRVVRCDLAVFGTLPKTALYTQLLLPACTFPLLNKSYVHYLHYIYLNFHLHHNSSNPTQIIRIK